MLERGASITEFAEDLDEDGEAPVRRSILEKVFVFAPFLLVLVGGAIGGLCGGAAVAVNLRIMNSDVSLILRLLAYIGTAVTAAAAYSGVIVLLAMVFPGLFA